MQISCGTTKNILHFLDLRIFTFSQLLLVCLRNLVSATISMQVSVSFYKNGNEQCQIALTEASFCILTLSYYLFVQQQINSDCIEGDEYMNNILSQCN